MGDGTNVPSFSNPRQNTVQITIILFRVTPPAYNLLALVSNM